MPYYPYFFTLKCHLRVKIQNFFLARSEFRINYYIFSKGEGGGAAKKHKYLFLT